MTAAANNPNCNVKLLAKPPRPLWSLCMVMMTSLADAMAENGGFSTLRRCVESALIQINKRSGRSRGSKWPRQPAGPASQLSRLDSASYAPSSSMVCAVATPATFSPAIGRLSICRCERCQDRGHDHTDADDFADHDPPCVQSEPTAI
jgi:hypothetical protein